MRGLAGRSDGWTAIETLPSTGPREDGEGGERMCRLDLENRRMLGFIVFAVAMWSFVLGYIAGPYLSAALSSSSSYDTIYEQARAYSTAFSPFGTPSVSFYNEYTKVMPLSGSYPWENIVEPYRTTTFEVSSPLSSSEYKYVWYVDGWPKDEGSTVEIAFGAPTGVTQTVSVSLVRLSDGKTLSTTSTNVMCKYVRREIRNLLDQDREAFFQAVAIMQRVPTQAGKKIYGKNYRSRDFFNRIHLYYGGSKSCDHWHQGPGFVTSHVTFSLMFEQSLQQINPSITLPYWDFTLESTFYTPSTFRGSGVFSADWFGDAECNNTEHTPTEGRFSYVPVMQNAQNFSSIVNPYSLLRSPWNADPTPYMTRSSLIYDMNNNLKPSGCKEYHHALQFSDWKSLAQQLNSNAHGHIHELMGGSWTKDKLIREPGTTAGLKEAYEFAHATEAYSKILWRYDFLTCPTECPSDAAEEDCQCYCSEENFKNMTSSHVLSSTGIIKSLVFFDKDGLPIESWQNRTTKQPYDALPGYSEEETTALYDEIMDVLCTPGYMGDMFQATSTNDITFWILHPTLERLWHLIRTNEYQGLVDFDHTWPDSDVTCTGHYSWDHTPFKNIFDSNNTVYTNLELYELLNPTRDEFPYVYDNFRYPHCSFLGYEMSGVDR